MEARLDHWHTQPHPAIKRPTCVELGAYGLRKPHAPMSYDALIPRLGNHDVLESRTQHAARFDQSKPYSRPDGSKLWLWRISRHERMSIYGMWPHRTPSVSYVFINTQPAEVLLYYTVLYVLGLLVDYINRMPSPPV